MSIKRNVVLIAIGGAAFVLVSALSMVVNSTVRSFTGVDADPPAKMKKPLEVKAKEEAQTAQPEPSKEAVQEQRVSNKTPAETGPAYEVAPPPPVYAPPPPPRVVGPGDLGHEPAPYYPRPVQSGPGNLN
jgi:hypothetical protein